MATTFSLHLPRPPTAAELRACADEPDLLGADAIPDDEWAEGAFLHLYVPAVSTRGVEVGPDDGEFTVRVLSCSGPEELALAVRLVVGLARAHGVTVARDGSGDLDADTFAETFGPAWIRKTVEEDFARLRTIAAERVLVMPGPTRDVSIGPATLARVGEGPEPLLRVMRDVLYPNGLAAEDEAEHYVSKGIEIVREGREILVHAIAPGVDYFLSGGDVYALIDEPVCHIPAAALFELAPDHVTPVDDASVRLRALTDDAWAEFLDRARAVGHTDPFDALPPPAAPARPPGTLLPLLRPHGWRNRDAVAWRPLLESRAFELPLITIVADTPTTTASLPKEGWPGGETATLAAAETVALANLDALDLPFEEDEEDGRLVGLTAVGEYASELILSPRRLAEVHAKLGELVVGAVPVRGIARFRRGDDVAATGTLVAWARYCFEDAGRQPDGPPGLTPHCFGIFEGRVQALVQTGPADTGPAEDGGGAAASPEETGVTAEPAEGAGPTGPPPDDVTEATEDGGGALQRAAQAPAVPEWSSLVTATPSTAPSPAPAPEEPPAEGKRAGPISGGLIGGAVVVLLVVAGIVYAAVR